MAFASGYLLYAQFTQQVLGMPLPVFTGLFYAVFITIAATLICLFLPRLTVTIESVALSRLSLALAATALPKLSHLMIASPLVNATLVVLIAAGIHHMLYRMPHRLPNSFGALRNATLWLNPHPVAA